MKKKITCEKCGGGKQIMGAGFMYRKCTECDGLGQIEVAVASEVTVTVAAKKRGRPARKKTTEGVVDEAI